MTAYHMTDPRLSYDRNLRQAGRAKRAAMWTNGAKASAVEYARASKAGLALVSPCTACREYVESAGAWLSTNDAIRLASIWFTSYYNSIEA